MSDDHINFDGLKCEEASMFSSNRYIPCGLPAVALVKNRDPKPYFMCEGCAYHNVRNRGAIIWARKSEDLQWLDTRSNSR